MISLGQKITIKIASDIKNLRKVSFKVLETLSPYKLDDSKLFDIRLCVEEAVRNAIVHGNHCDKHLAVKISCWMEDGKFNIEVEDEGAGFDYKNLPDPTTDENIMRNNGRGVYLIAKLMDEIKYEGSGNIVRMIKYL